MKIYSRTEWGARHRAGSRAAADPAQRVWLHHTAGRSGAVSSTVEQDFQLIRQLEDLGQSRFGAGISYTFIITRSGRIFEGTGPGRVGTHTARQNTASRAICLTGNYQNIKPNQKQLDALIWLLTHGAASGWWAHPQLAGGHRDAPGAATACPGNNLHSLIAEINMRAENSNSSTVNTVVNQLPTQGRVPAAPRQAASSSSRPVLRRGARGPHVADLQAALGISANGIFGPQTERAVRGFQQKHRLTVDGIVGPQTWGALDRVKEQLDRPVLRMGDRGEHVAYLQQQLRKRNPAFPGRNAIFGPRTHAEVRAHQRRSRITVDGIVGPQTWATLR